MAQPPLPLEEATRRIAAIDRAIAAGYPTLQAACDAASELLGISRITLRSCLPGIKQKYGMEPQPVRKPGPIAKPFTMDALPDVDLTADEILTYRKRQFQLRIAALSRSARTTPRKRACLIRTTPT